MPGRLRITIGAPADNAALLAALESLVAAAA
jgi:histidinol-phosphate/aromatic aminotransferase/cobyric acid decarboxylase-like protein